jgi:hypothetical protein
MIMVPMSATVMRTVPALKEDTPEVTVSPGSTLRRMTTPSMGAVTFSRWRLSGGGRWARRCPGRMRNFSTAASCAARAAR